MTKKTKCPKISIKNNQQIRHETPVLSHPIKIIHIDNDLIVLDKPCSVPVSSSNCLCLSTRLIMQINSLWTLIDAPFKV